MSDPCEVFVSLLTSAIAPFRVGVFESFGSEDAPAYDLNQYPQPYAYLQDISAVPFVQNMAGAVFCTEFEIQISSFSFTREQAFTLSDLIDAVILGSELSATLNTGPLYLFDAENRTHAVIRTYQYLQGA